MISLLDKTNLLNDAERYFNLLQESFVYTRNDNKNTSATDRIRSLTFWTLPIILLLFFVDLSEYTGFIKNNAYYISIVKYLSFYTKNWFVIVVCCYVSIFVLTGIVDFFIAKRKKPKLLDYSYYDFCLIFDSYSNLKSYLINRRKEYFESAIKSINEYNSNMSTTIDVIESDPGLRWHGNPVYQINQLKRRYTWFKVTNETQIIASGYGKFPYLVRENIKSNNNIEYILELIELIVIYEYCKILTQSDIREKTEIESYGYLSIFKFGEKVNEMWQNDEIQENQSAYHSLGAILSKYITLFNLGIKSSKITIRLFCWWVFLQIPITIIVLLLAKALNVNFDGDVIAAIAGAPITIAAGLAVFDTSKSEQ